MLDYLVMFGLAIFIVGIANILKCEKIKKLQEEIKHVRFNNLHEINRNLELQIENVMLKRQYNEMVQENLRLHRDFDEVLKK